MAKISISENQFKAGLWIMGSVVVLMGVYVWYEQRIAGGSELGRYDFFPVLGITAFSLMWTHYVGGALRDALGFDKRVFRTYFSVTAWIVLLLILLHPGIFWFLLMRDGLGLPPGSYLTIYTDMASRAALLLGTLSLAAFLVFEFHRRFSASSWWKYVEIANIFAMGAIFYHALTLGGELSVEWFRVVWYVYGLTLAAAIGYSYIYKRIGGRHEK
jgi:hypothetical protein